MKEAKKGECKKCGVYFYVHDHHILPKSIFGKKGETAKLCPNCHTHFHEYSKKQTTNPHNAQEAWDIWDEWLTSVSIIVTVWVIGLLFYFF